MSREKMKRPGYSAMVFDNKHPQNASMGKMGQGRKVGEKLNSKAKAEAFGGHTLMC